MKRVFVILSLVALCAAGWPRTAAAHPLGNFTVNRYSRIELKAGQISLRHILDYAEVPAFQEIERFDLDRDGQLVEGERAAYLDARINQIRAGLHLRRDGAPVELQPQAADLSFPPGQGGLPTLRLVVDFVAPLPADLEAGRIEYRDDYQPERIGWREIVIQSAGGVTIRDSTAPANDISTELTTYPDDLLQSPLNQRTAAASFTMTGAATANLSSAVETTDQLAARQTPIGRGQDAFADLIATPDLSLLVLLMSLAAAFGLGMIHGLSPGHGKTVVGAYLVGARGTAWHALFLGLTVTLTHTIGVFALGLVTLFASQYVVPERLYPWFSLASGLLILLIGLTLFVTRLRGIFATPAGNYPTVHHHHHEQEHQSHHEAPDLNSSHHRPVARDKSEHPSEHHFHRHGPEDEHSHRHGLGAAHSHHPPAGALTWRSLIALGISGGLIPCPSALVVLLSAIALQRIGFGLLLIVVFSAGLASILTAIGLVLVWAGHLLGRLKAPPRLIQAVPSLGALLVAGLGSLLVWEALVQGGWRL